MSRQRSDKLRQRVGIAMMAGSLGVAGSVLSLAPAGAQADPVPVEVEKTAHYVYNSGQAAPNTLTSEFPPGVLCVVEPRLCPEDLAPAFEAIGGAAGTVEEAPEEPASTVQPGTLPVEIFSGVDKMVSAVKLKLPELEPGAEVGTFVLRLQQIQPSYHSSSPMFRQAVLAAVASAGQGSPNQEEFAEAAQTPPAEFDQILGVEACPTTEDWQAAGRGGTEAQPESAIPSVDCLFGSNGVKLPDSDIWEFDLTFAAEAWYAGDLENTGILLRSTGAPNLAFGDPDSSTHSRVTFDPQVATATVEERPSSEGSTFTPPPSSGTNSGTSSPGFSAPSSSGNIFAPPANFSPEVAAGGEQPAQVADDGQVAQQPVAAVPFLEGGDPLTPWWIWLLVPIFLAGMYLTAQTLTTEVVLASERDGAMMRLIDQRRGGSLGASSTPSGPREGALTRLTGRK